ncbi:hypothetical protein ACS15_2907 [Ralstonia insidiosa]|uniref:Uncharacterized protein n=1 Tax=Ralstonia insidiosa TaxID=190721 RepID=A0AAC9BHT7_9RALS|nr:hypothetical protein ACS15_2907 [Ralstonia insidiosa]
MIRNQSERDQRTDHPPGDNRLHLRSPIVVTKRGGIISIVMMRH